MIKNYIFDFGNVLAEFYPAKLTAPYVPDEETKASILELFLHICEPFSH